jgi:hypothetical protein
MATHHGREGVVKLTTNTIAEVTGFSFDISMSMIDDTALTDSAKTFIPDQYTWTGTIECHWDETDTNGQAAMETAILAGTSLTLNLYPEGASTGDRYFSGTAYLTSMGTNVSMGSTIKATYAFQGSGAITPGTAA